jgi:hypothetical protein
MKDLSLIIKDGFALTVGIIVLMMNLNLHTQNMLLKPAEFLHSLGHILGHKLAARGTRMSIPHEGIWSNWSWCWLGLLHIEPLNLVCHTLLAEIMILESVFDEPHDEGSIGKGAPADHSIKHLIEDKVHHIKREIRIRVGGLGTTMSEDEKIHQGATNSIVVTSTRSNILPVRYA